MWRRTSRDRIFIGLLLLSTLAVLTVDFRTGALEGLSNATSEIFGVFQSGVRTLARPVEGAAGMVHDLGRLRTENERLRAENEMLRRQAETYSDVVRENARMRELLQIEGSLDLPTLRARVIGASLSGLERAAYLDKGRNAGIEPDRAVIGPEGLVGRTVQVTNRTTKVLLITDSQSAIGVRIGETGETGSVVGMGGRDLRLELVSRAALDQEVVKRGDVVVTSGYEGGIYPAGIPIGRVEEVSLAARGTAYAIRVRPYARLSRLDVVSVALSGGVAPESFPLPRTEEAG